MKDILTLGPWEKTYDPVCKRFSINRKLHAEHVCITKNEANADFIVAAFETARQKDELLKAIKLLVAEYQGRKDFDDYKTKSSTGIAKAKAAIANAEKK